MIHGRKQLGKKLRAVRKECGVTGPELARRLGCSQSFISKVENGLLKPSLSFVQKFADALQLSKARARELTQFAEFFVVEFDRWSAEEEGITERLQLAVAERIRAAKIIRSFEWFLVCGLLQTRAYATALFQKLGVPSGKDFERAIDVRLGFQRLLSHRDKRVQIIMSESALLTCVGNEEVMEEQRSHISTMVSRYPNLEVRFLPHSTELLVVPVTGFCIFDESLVNIEARQLQIHLWREEEVSEYLGLFRALFEQSRPADLPIEPDSYLLQGTNSL